MPLLDNASRARLLEMLRLDAGQAEASSSPAKEIYPIAEHIRAIEPGVALIVGDRGAGKTQLKNALTDDRLRTALLRHAATVRAQGGSAHWCTGWPLNAAGPDPLTWATLARKHRESREDLMVTWLAYFVRTIATHLAVGDAVQALMKPPSIDAEQCLEVCRRHNQQLVAAIDKLDAELQEQNRWIIVAYDELDVVVVDDWEALGTVIRGLVTLWATYARRWQRIRPKIFLRTDFYRHHREIAGADVAKLAANRVELAWSDKNLYGALIKHVVNKDEQLRDHFVSSVDLTKDEDLGWLPRLATADDARGFVQRLVGEYMGANPKKGDAFTWILDHLRDGNDRALPRTLVWLIEFAAERELGDMRAKGARLLHHVSLRNALDLVSKQYVQHSETHEFRWIRGLERRLSADREVPWTRKELEKLLAKDFHGSWSSGDHGSVDVRPPGTNHLEVLDNLAGLGIFRVRGKDSLDVPDLYLSGLNLRRRGGVAKE